MDHRTKSALGRNEARDRTWLVDWLKRDGRSLGDPGKNPGAAISWKPASAWVCPTSRCWARYWLLFGQAVQPVPGTVLVFERGSGGHVGFAVGQDDTHFFVLGCNQSDAVTIARVACSACRP